MRVKKNLADEDEVSENEILAVLHLVVLDIYRGRGSLLVLKFWRK